MRTLRANKVRNAVLAAVIAALVFITGLLALNQNDGKVMAPAPSQETIL